MCSEQLGGWFLVYSSWISIVCLKCSSMKNVCSKQVGGCFLVYSSLVSIVHLKCFTTKNVCSKQVGGCFLIYSSWISLVQKMCVQSKWEAVFLVYSFLISNVCLKCFTTNFIKTSMNRCFLNCCFLVYSWNFIKLLQMAAF